MVASTVPLLIFAAVMTTLFERQQRASVERGLRDTARALTLAVDHELFASISVLQALAASEPLETGNLGSFYVQAHRGRLREGGRLVDGVLEQVREEVASR